MKVIHIPQYKKNLVFFEKAGSSLMAGFFKGILNFKGIEIAGRLSGNNNWGGDKILFVRNPLERLVSIFYHLNIVRGSDMTVDEKINALDKFLDGYEEKCKNVKDSHLQSQSWEYQMGEGDRLIKIEDVRNGYDIITDGYRASSNMDFKSKNGFFNETDYIKNFGFIEDIGIPMDDKDRLFAVTLYGFILGKLNEGHHHNESHLMIGWLKNTYRRDVLDKLTHLTKDEMDRFGYNNYSLL